MRHEVEAVSGRRLGRRVQGFTVLKSLGFRV